MRDQNPLLFTLLAALVSNLTTWDALAADGVRTEPPAHVSSFRLPDRLNTLDGKTYEKVILDKVEADGLLVSFSPMEGGSGTAKLKFRNLPVELREHYRYDAESAAEHELAQARGEAVWRAEHAVRMQQMEAARAEQAAWERQIRARREEAEQARAEAARESHVQPSNYFPGWSSGWYGYGGYESTSHRRGSRFKNHAPHQMSAVGETTSPISPFMGPMRPSGK